jgi:hypothetical protein
LTVLDEKRLILKGIPVGSWFKPATGMGTGRTLDTHGLTHAIAYTHKNTQRNKIEMSVYLGKARGSWFEREN